MRKYAYTTEIHSRICKVRLALDKSQRAMAREMGYAATYFSKLESNQEYFVSEHLALAICHTFGVSYDYLVFGEGAMFVDDEHVRAMNDTFKKLTRKQQYSVLKFAEFLAAQRVKEE